ncbi:hypothetical protein KCU85_g373, partial [Aureobasidium melanogenum]
MGSLWTCVRDQKPSCIFIALDSVMQECWEKMTQKHKIAMSSFEMSGVRGNRLQLKKQSEVASGARMFEVLPADWAWVAMSSVGG